jgi:PIN domain nuclease of toxin-antitoxin system
LREHAPAGIVHQLTQTREHGLSFADRACLALGIQRNRRVLTSEKRMALPVLSIKVKLIRNAH